LSLGSDGQRKGKKRKDKLKKPVEQRRGSTSSGASLNGAVPDEAMEGLADFFTNLNAQLLPVGASVSARELDLESIGDLQEIEDVGQLARDLIRRIQSLRGQFRPGSVAARALPDVRFEEIAMTPPEPAPQTESSASEEEMNAQEMDV
jgi:hypothetical protein